MEKLQKVVSWADGPALSSLLMKAEVVAPIVKMKAARLIELADAGYAPHYRVDGGEPLFNRGELSRWVRAHLQTACAGKPIAEDMRVMLFECQPADPAGVPDCLGAIVGLKELPTSKLPPCIYFLCKGNEVVYVGESVELPVRVCAHDGVKEFDRVFYLPCPRSDRQAVEMEFVRRLKPKYNYSSRGTLCA